MTKTTIHGATVLERWPVGTKGDNDVVLVHWPDSHDPYVTGIVAHDDSSPREWYWGRYHRTITEAVSDLIERAKGI